MSQNEKYISQNSKVEEYLRIEAEMRRCNNIQELSFFIANEIRHMIKAEHIFVFKRNFNGRFNLISASDIAIIDRNTPAIVELENMLAQKFKKISPKKNSDIKIANDQEETKPFSTLSWFPFFIGESEPYAGMLVAKSHEWTQNDTTISERLVENSAYCWAAISTRKKILKKKYTSKKIITFSLLTIAILALFIPVPLTTIAPMEVIPENPAVIAATIDGVIEKISVKPNQNVKKGQILYKMTDTKLVGQVEITKKEINLAQASLETIQRAAFLSQKDKHQIAIEKAKLELKKAQYKYTKNQFQKTIMKAPKNGIVIFSDAREWIGKPVVAGQKIMEIAKAENILFRIYVPTSDVSVIRHRGKIRLFLDSDALSPINAQIIRADHNAKITEKGNLAFNVIAKAEKIYDDIPRLGTRGTAQIFGDNLPLFLFLLRRPIVALRQWSGI